MINRRAQPIDFETTALSARARRVDSIDAVPSSGGANERRVAGVGQALADRIGRFSDELTVQEARRDGLKAGLDPQFRPTGGFSLRDRTRDEVGTDVYLSRVGARFDEEAMALYERHKADPAGFNAAFGAFTRRFADDNVFDEIRPAFEERASRLRLSLAPRVLDAFEARRADQARASLVEDMATRDNARARLLAGDPFGADIDALVARNVAEQSAAIDAQVRDGHLSAEQGARLKLQARKQSRLDVIQRRAETLSTPEDVAAYRLRLREDLAAGKLTDLDPGDVERLDGALSTQERRLTADGDQRLAAYGRKLDDLMQRAGAGYQPTLTEWTALETEARALGPRGDALMATARDKLLLRERLRSRPLDEAEAELRALETATAQGDVVDRIIGVESGGRADARNPNSSAKGLGQFVAGTWLAMIKEHRPDLAEGRTREEILALRADPALSREMTTHYVEKNRARLDAAGVAPTPGAIYLAHFLGAGDAIKVLRADPSQAASDVVQPSSVAANASVLGNGRTIGGLIAWADRKMGSRAGVSAAAAGVLADGRAYMERRRRDYAERPLIAAAADGIIGDVAPLSIDDPTRLAAEIAPRLAQVDIVARQTGRAVPIFDVDERPRVVAALNAGGDRALDVMGGLLRGAPDAERARIVAELGDDAPAMAQAASLMIETGDRSFAAQVAEGLRQRAQPGAKAVRPRSTDADAAYAAVVGPANRLVDASERARIVDAASAYFEVEAARRGVEPGTPEARDLLDDAMRRAAGSVTIGRRTFGGVGMVDPVGWGVGATMVRVPPDVETDRFGDVLAALTDADLGAGDAAPVTARGRAATAADVARLTPMAVPGGYVFADMDERGRPRPLRRADGQPWVLQWARMGPILRARVPDAFR
jgi:hypothetical protein